MRVLTLSFGCCHWDVAICCNFCHSSRYEQYFLMDIIYLSLITNDFEHILCVCWPSAYLLMYLFKHSVHFNKWLNMSYLETAPVRAIQVSAGASLVKGPHPLRDNTTCHQGTSWSHLKHSSVCPQGCRLLCPQQPRQVSFQNFSLFQNLPTQYFHLAVHSLPSVPFGIFCMK